MKVRNMLVLLIMFLGLIDVKIALSKAQEAGIDDYGILRGKIINEDTGMLVFEKFLVRINDPNIKYSLQIERFGTETDDKGLFSCKLKPGAYLLYFNPISRTSKYCWDSNPLNLPEEKQVIIIEKGKITEIVKKAKLAGRLKLIMVSKEGHRINPKEIVGEKANFSVRFYANWLLDTFDATFFSADEDDFNDGEIVVY